jgi:hypothetical protein
VGNERSGCGKGEKGADHSLESSAALTTGRSAKKETTYSSAGGTTLSGFVVNEEKGR